ncbi:MAG TPA: biopolymer transporter ExbD [Kofleriaceae bacterium]|nr:biopolymer transporter ExbD [Kofleriaceae bacterium]
MGMNVGGSGGGPRSDINVTPLVDVVLVLLIIFMVSMPIMLKHITIEVPRKLDADEVSVTSSQIVLIGKADGTVEVDDGSGKRSVNRIDLAKTLRPMIQAIKTERVVFVDFEDEMVYTDVISIMDTVRGLGRDASGQFTNPVKVALKVRETGAAIPAQ